MEEVLLSLIRVREVCYVRREEEDEGEREEEEWRRQWRGRGAPGKGGGGTRKQPPLFPSATFTIMLFVHLGQAISIFLSREILSFQQNLFQKREGRKGGREMA